MFEIKMKTWLFLRQHQVVDLSCICLYVAVQSAFFLTCSVVNLSLPSGVMTY